MEEAKIRVLEFVVLGKGSRWSKKELAAATKIDPKIAQFSAWMSARRLRIDGIALAGYDPITKGLHAQWERFSVRKGVLFRRYWSNGDRADSWQVVLPVCYREEAMESAHQSVSGGHMGVRKTQSKLAMRAYLVGWTVDVREYCKRCNKCARYHRGGVKKPGMLQTMCVGAPWERVAIDFTGPRLVSSMGNKFIIMVMDHFTKFGFAFLVRNHEAPTVAKYLVERVFLIYGVPLQLLSDRGAEFEGNIFGQLRINLLPTMHWRECIGL